MTVHETFVILSEAKNPVFALVQGSFAAKNVALG
jgi:hypothetical protein